MSKKNIVSKTVDTVVGTVQEYGYALLLGVVFLGVVVTKSGEVKAAKKVATECIEVIEGVNFPDNAAVINSSTYTTGLQGCDDEDLITLCQICYNPEEFPSVDGMLDFDDPENDELNLFIQANKLNFSLHNIPTQVPGTSKFVTLKFRKLQ